MALRYPITAHRIDLVETCVVVLFLYDGIKPHRQMLDEYCDFVCGGGRITVNRID